MSATLFIVATPLGNLADASPRLRTCLAQVAWVYAEDTRRTGLLLQHLEVRARLRSLHAHNEAERLDEALRRLQAGEDIAYLSDAGTPAISDPGGRLVAAAHAAGLRVSPICGPSALSAALSVAGFAGLSRLPVPVRFWGFLPAAPAARRAALTQVSEDAGVVVLFETARRLPRLLQALAAAHPQRQACLCRELSKLHEQVLRLPLAELSQLQDAWRGECTLVLGPQAAAAPPPPDDAGLQRALAACRAAGIGARDAARCLAAIYGRPRRELYAQLLGEAR